MEFLKKMKIWIGVIIISFLMGNVFQIYPILIKQKVLNEIKDLYEVANPGYKAEIISAIDISGIYKIVLKLSGPSDSTYIETYVTKDGKLLTQSVIYAEESLKKIQSLKNFVDCLNQKGLKIYGITNQSYSEEGAYATSLQLNLLGRYSPIIFVSCDGDRLQTCVNNGITQVPSIVYNGRVYPGVKTVDWIANLTGCKIE